jgi:ParB-like chromosome segregation protein Spo0J
MTVNSLRSPDLPVKVDASRRDGPADHRSTGWGLGTTPTLHGHIDHERSAAMNLRKVPLDDLVLDPNLNLRDRLDDFTVERYADSWDRLPPITVFEVEDRLLLADGFHRHAAAIMLGKRTIPAEVREGMLSDALDFVASVNLFHGLPLTRAERRRAVEIKLKLHHDWSDRRMAEELAVSRELVAKIRRQLIEAQQIPNLPGRVGSDGKLYTSAGLPRDPNERLPRDNKEGGGEDAAVERGRRGMNASAAPWEETKAVPAEPDHRPEPAYDLAPTPRETRATALAEPVETAEATIDEMLELMSKQVQQVVDWTKAEGFDEAYRSARSNVKALFQAAVYNLGNRANQLLKLR